MKDQLGDLRDQLKDLTSSKSVERKKNADVQYCITRECIAASNNLFQWMNLDANPCDDFNEFACGNFIIEQPIPNDISFIVGTLSFLYIIFFRCKRYPL